MIKAAALLAALAAASLAPAARAAPPEPTAAQHLQTEALEIATAKGPARFNVELALTPREQEVGLMFRRRLGEREGMIFDFHEAAPQAFWMRNTPIPLDMLFVTADGHVLTVARDAQPMTDTPIPSGGPARAVIEIKGGLAAKLDIQPGDRVTDARVFPPAGPAR